MIFERALASLNQINPHQTIATFIFADDKPNANRQGLPFSEFPNIVASSVGMPIKMRFTGFGTGDHDGSIPIGVITSMETVTVSDDYHQLVAKAALWNDEFPEEVEWLKKAFAEGKAPGISYEINYASATEADGVSWLKDSFTGAATFVKHPAHGTRTALLALASIQDKTEVEKGIIALAEELTKPKKIIKGGNQMDEKELEALKQEHATFKAEAASKQSEIETLMAQLAEKDSTNSTLTAELDSLKRNTLIETRVRKYTDLGLKLDDDAEKADKKKALIASFTDEQFDDYVTELSTIQTSAAAAIAAATPAPAAGLTAMASLANKGVPKLELPAEETNYQTLRQGMRNLARPNTLE